MLSKYIKILGIFKSFSKKHQIYYSVIEQKKEKRNTKIKLKKPITFFYEDRIDKFNNINLEHIVFTIAK